ncbi:hypothetical protein DFA_03056 [Cavenderia fasciculata]|uniref:HP domain-containing protein n=1 Tax=Cavenderia fasciculata TaxID=261658 RepID=F4PGH7_CACFS|nr:uncharacterized protein DFA_03056 [Cavenderia fasciculata]EGG24811.1 hypothetical protein DFA_03056 [Cavenderia fasciculata]|eukprot:XP_004362662.1 hypothetical protein DFA_03056 [Cavenderia fasciculata]
MIAVEALPSLAQLKNLRRLDVSKCKIGSEVIFALASLPLLIELNLRNENRLSDDTFTKGGFPWHHLVSLDLTSCSKLSDVSFVSLPPCPNFQTLILESCYNLTDVTINSISTKMTSLTKLSLKGCKFITDSSLVPLSQRLSKLQDLKLSRCHSITSVSLQAIATNLCNTLDKIDLSMCPQLEESSIQNLIIQCPKLISVNLSENPNITQNTLTIINDLTNLLHLKLDSCPKLIDDGSLTFSNLEKLQTLSIQKLQISHQSFLNMTTVLSKLTYISLKQCYHLNELSFTGLNLLTQLEYLDLSNNSRVLDGTMISICNHLKNLKHLDLTLCIRLTTKSFLQIGKHLQSLETLILSGCANLNDANVIHLAENLCLLRHLDLSSAGLLTDRSVHFLADHLLYLEKLFLRECNNITQAAIDYIKSKCTLFRLTRLSLHSLPLVGELRNASPSEILKPIKINEGTTSEWRLQAKERANKQKELEKTESLQREQEKRMQLLQQQKEEVEARLKKKKREEEEQAKKIEVVEIRYRDYEESLGYKELLQRPVTNPPIDPNNLEKYLNDESFQQVFHLKKSTFYSLPKWKSDKLKKDLNLF